MQRERIAHYARLAGLELGNDTQIEVTGDDPVLPSPFHLGEGAATALALVGQEASRIWQLRGGDAQALRVDVRHAAASLRSYEHLKVDVGGEPLARRGTGVTAIWECGDGRFIHLHGSFTHTEGILAELGLGLDATAEDVAAACMKRGAFELEDALAAKGLCCAVCRTAEEWAAHPQGALLATKPVVEVERIGDGPVVPLHEAERPLSNVRVLDLTRVLAGPTCARTLAEHGADVLHIASPNLPTIPNFEMDTGHGKRQAYLDLNDPAQAETLRALVRGADVFSQGFQHRSLERRGFGVRQLAELRPGIIYVSENAFGLEGPWQERPGWEQLAQSTTGVAVTQGGDQRPVLAPAAMNDYTTGYFAALGTMIALRRRATEGGSWSVRVSLSQTSMWYYRLGTDLDRNAATGLGDVTPFLESRETGYGYMTHLRPPLWMHETKPHWTLPTAPLGSDGPEWVQAELPRR
ncbi:MAG: CoA transferase [Dehalococcoidia bacterium]|nr:CoA transferase [Dehalococcoidia bacterium]